MCSAYVQTFDRSGGLIPSRRSRRKYGRVATDWDGTTWLMDAPQQKIQASSQATTRLVSIPNKVDGSYDETFSGERADVRERSAGDPPMRSGERTVRYRPMGYQDRHHIGPGVHSSCAGQPSTDRRQGKSCLTGPPCPSCPTCWDNSLCPPRPRDQGVTAEETVLKAQVRGKENMLLRDRNDLNSDPDGLIAGSSWVLQHPQLRILRDSAEDFRITPPRDQTITDSSLRGLFPDRDDHPLMLTKGKRLRGLQDATLIGCLDFQCHGFGSRSCGVRWWLYHARRRDSTWQGPPWESVPCVVGHGRIIRPRVRTSIGPGRPSERRGRVAGREVAARPAVELGGGRAAGPCVPVPEVSQTWRSYSTASRPGSLQIPGASVLAQNDRGASGSSGTPGPVPSGTPSAGRRDPDQRCEASVDRWGSGSKIRVSVKLLD